MKLKSSLLYIILENQAVSNKYSKSFLNLKNVIELELNEGFKLNDLILDEFEKLEMLYNNFINQIPLIIVERYYNDNKENYNKFVYLEFNEKELTDLKIIELFKLLEDYHERIFNLAVKIADLYNLEIKIGNENNKSNDGGYL